MAKVPAGPGRVWRIPVIRSAREQLGRSVVANLVALGVIARAAATTR